MYIPQNYTKEFEVPNNFFSDEYKFLNLENITLSKLKADRIPRSYVILFSTMKSNVFSIYDKALIHI